MGDDVERVALRAGPNGFPKAGTIVHLKEVSTDYASALVYYKNKPDRSVLIDRQLIRDRVFDKKFELGTSIIIRNNDSLGHIVGHATKAAGGGYEVLLNGSDQPAVMRANKFFAYTRIQGDDVYDAEIETIDMDDGDGYSGAAGEMPSTELDAKRRKVDSQPPPTPPPVFKPVGGGERVVEPFVEAHPLAAVVQSPPPPVFAEAHKEETASEPAVPSLCGRMLLIHEAIQVVHTEIGDKPPTHTRQEMHDNYAALSDLSSTCIIEAIDADNCLDVFAYDCKDAKILAAARAVFKASFVQIQAQPAWVEFTKTNKMRAAQEILLAAQ